MYRTLSAGCHAPFISVPCQYSRFKSRTSVTMLRKYILRPCAYNLHPVANAFGASNITSSGYMSGLMPFQPGPKSFRGERTARMLIPIPICAAVQHRGHTVPFTTPLLNWFVPYLLFPYILFCIPVIKNQLYRTQFSLMCNPVNQLTQAAESLHLFRSSITMSLVSGFFYT